MGKFQKLMNGRMSLDQPNFTFNQKALNTLSNLLVVLVTVNRIASLNRLQKSEASASNERDSVFTSIFANDRGFTYSSTYNGSSSGTSSGCVEKNG